MAIKIIMATDLALTIGGTVKMQYRVIRVMILNAQKIC